MDKADYLKGVRELYAAEIEGEGLAARWLELATDPEQKYKLSLFLQLESEAKVRLRPLLARYGISLVEDPSQRQLGFQGSGAIRSSAMEGGHGGVVQAVPALRSPL